MRAIFSSLAFKVGALLLLAVAAVGLLAYEAWVSARDISANVKILAQHMGELEKKSIALMETAGEVRADVAVIKDGFTDYAATRGADGLDDGIDNARQAYEKATADLGRIREIVADFDSAEINAVLAKVDEKLPLFMKAGEQMARAYKERGTEFGNLIMPAFDELSEALDELMEQLIGFAHDAAKTEMDEVMEQVMLVRSDAADASWAAQTFGVAGLVAVLLAALYLGFAVVWPLRRLSVAIGADASTDSALPSMRRHDEIGEVARAIHEFRSRVAEAAEERVRTIQELADTLETRLSEATAAILDYVRKMRSEVDEVATSSEQLGEGTSQAAQSAGHAQESARNVAASTQELAQAVGEIAQQVGIAASTTSDVVSIGQSTRESLDSLSELARTIGNVTNTIAEIAEQTNLLALNATIEAARAGEAGRGFAVVANEVKALANQTASATEDVGRQIEAVQQAANAAIEAMDKILGRIGEIDKVTGTIASAVEEQHATTRDIGEAVQKEAAEVEQISAAIATAAEIARQNRERAAVVAELTSKLDAVASDLSSTLVRLVRTASKETDRRAEPRLPVSPELPVSVDYEGRRLQARVLDASRKGLRLDRVEGATPGGTLRVTGLIEQPLAGRIVGVTAEGIHVKLELEGPVVERWHAWVDARGGSSARAA